MFRIFNNLKVQYLLFLGFGLLIVLTLGMGFFAIEQQKLLSGLTQKMHDHPLTVSNAVRDVDIGITKMRARLLNIGNPEKDFAFIKSDIAAEEKLVHEAFKTIYDRFLGDKDDVDNLKRLFEEWKAIRDEIIAWDEEGKHDIAIQAVFSGKGYKHLTALRAASAKLMVFADGKATEFLKMANTQATDSKILIWTVMFVMAVVGAFIAFFVARLITKPLNSTILVSRQIAMGNLNNDIDTSAKNELGQLASAFDDMQTQLRERIEEDKRIADEALRINRALDNVTTNVIISDSHYNIIYLNNAAQNLFTSAENKIRTDIVGFDASNIVGKNIDFFHKNPDHQQQLLGQLTNSHSSTLKVGGLTLDSTITPVISSDGERLGVVMEINNRTDEVAIEEEVNSVVHKAAQGDFSQRVDLKNKSGFFKTISESLNQIMDFNQRMIDDMIRLFSALAQGDLTKKIDRNYTGIFEQLKNDANATVNRLTEIMLVIQRAADEVNKAAEEISQGNTSLSQRTEEQAASLEETAASMEEMTSSVQQNADNARQATQLAASARDRATRGGQVVNLAVDAMSRISTSSKKVTDIIGVINDIAFQTNLLALNAAVEAARAGEQGRGFAVVASEVRSLAQRSAEAAKEIKGLIEDSVNKVTEGTKLVNESGTTLKEIMDAVKKVSDIVSEISAASQEQSSGIHQVNKAIGQMDEMTQQNASLVQEAASASESMNDQSRNLKKEISFFTIGRN